MLSMPEFMPKLKRTALLAVLGLVVSASPARATPDTCATYFTTTAKSLAETSRERIRNLYERGRLSEILRSDLPVIAAHGKNVNIAPEHTWLNFHNSLQDGARVLEMDIQLTRDGEFILVHDPTLHRVVKDYQTSAEKVARFERENPKLAAEKRAHWDYLLLDRISSMTSLEIKRQHLLHDPHRETFYEFITLEELLKATDVPGQFRIPSFTYSHSADPAAHIQHPAQHYRLPFSPVIFLDLKDLNALTRRLWQLESWDWIKNAQPTEILLSDARKMIARLSSHLEKHQAFDRVFVPARHPVIARLFREIDPRIAIMMSPEATADQSPDLLISQLAAFMDTNPELVEIKYLRHLKDERIRDYLRARRIKVFFDQIVQTDPTQFQGVYENNPERLLSDVVKEGIDIVIQTNTPKLVSDYMKKLTD